MNVVNLLIIISIVILLPSSIGDIAKCPADDIVGCSCHSNRINCRRDYPVNNNLKQCANNPQCSVRKNILLFWLCFSCAT